MPLVRYISQFNELPHNLIIYLFYKTKLVSEKNCDIYLLPIILDNNFFICPDSGSQLSEEHQFNSKNFENWKQIKTNKYRCVTLNIQVVYSYMYAPQETGQ